MIVAKKFRLNVWVHTGWRGYLFRMWKYRSDRLIR